MLSKPKIPSYSKVLILLIANFLNPLRDKAVKISEWTFGLDLTVQGDTDKSHTELRLGEFHVSAKQVVLNSAERPCCLKLLTEGIIKLIAVTLTASHRALIVILSINLIA